jgi:AraC-like DNA-binding protein
MALTPRQPPPWKRKTGGMWVDASFVREVAGRLRAAGCPVDEKLRRRGIAGRPLASGDSVSLAVFVELLERGAEWLGDPHFGLTCAREMKIRTFGNLVGYLGLCSETVLEALRNMQRYAAIVADHLSIDLQVGKEAAVVTVNVHELDWIGHRQLAEFGMGRIVAALRELTDRPLRPDRVEFAHPRGGRDKACERFFGCTVLYGQPRDRLVLAPAILGRPIAGDPGLLVLLRRYSDTLVELKGGRHPMPTADRVRLTTARLMPSGRARARDIAVEMGVSERSLRRRLDDEGTSLRAILEEVRKTHALSWLEQRTMSPKQAASLLGYSDASAFSRAFKRWTGRTPGRARIAAVQ